MLDLTLTANGLVFAGVAALQTTVDLKRVLREIRVTEATASFLNSS